MRRKLDALSIVASDYAQKDGLNMFAYTLRGRSVSSVYDPGELDALLGRVNGELNADALALGRSLRRMLGVPALGKPGKQAQLVIVDALKRRSIPWEMLAEGDSFLGCAYAVSHAVPSGVCEFGKPQNVDTLLIMDASGHPASVEVDGRMKRLAPLVMDGESIFNPLCAAAMAPFKKRGKCDIIHLHSATATYSQYTLGMEKGAGSSVVVFMGHIAYGGQNTPYLVLNESPIEDGTKLTPDFAPLLSRQELPPALVILCACGPGSPDESHDAAVLAKKLIAQGVRSVVLAQREVESTRSVEFIECFVRRLFEDDGRSTVAECLRRARCELVKVGRASSTLFAFQYHGDKDLRISVGGPKAKCRRALKKGAAVFAAVAAAALLAFALWKADLFGVGAAGPPFATLDLVQKEAARIDTVQFDWQSGKLSLRVMQRSSELAFICLIRVSGRWHIKPYEQVEQLRFSDSAELSLFTIETDKKAVSVVVYLMNAADANLQDFIDMGQITLSPPKYVLDEARVDRE